MTTLKTARTTFLMGLAFHLAPLYAQEKDVHDLAPKHGGVVVEHNHKEYELVLKAEGSFLYIRDHGKPMDLNLASAKLTVLSDGKKAEVAMKGNANTLQGGPVQVGAAYTALATVEFADKKKSTVRFKGN